MADGKVVISTALDNSGFEKDAKKSAKSMAATLAAEYRKQGHSQSDALKKAWAEINRDSKAAGQKAGQNIHNGISSGVKAAEGSLGGLKNVLRKFTLLFASVFSVAALVQFGKQSVQLASDLEEVQNVVDTAFGAMSYKLEEFAATAIETVGLSKLAAKQMGSIFMAMSTGMGQAMDIGSDKAVEMVRRLGDIMSFYNKNLSEVETIGRAVYSGETEPLKQIGIVMTQNNLELFAMQQGYKRLYGSMSAAEQLLVRQEFFLNATRLAAGDFVKTQDSWANQTRILSERWKEFQTELGKAFIQLGSLVLPILNQLLTSLAGVAQMAQAAASWIYTAITGRKLAVSQTQLESSAIEGAVGNQEALTDATKETAKAAKKTTASFDELNLLSEKNGAGGGSGSGGSGSGGGVTAPLPGGGADFDLTEPELPEGLRKFFEKMREVIEKVTPLVRDIGDALAWLWKEVLIPLSDMVFGDILETVAAGLELLGGAVSVVKAIGVTGVITGIATALLAYTLTGNLPLAVAIGALVGALAQLIENYTDIKVLPAVITGISAAFIAFKWGGFAAGSAGLLGLGAALIMFAEINDLAPILKVALTVLGGAFIGLSVALKAGFDIKTLNGALLALQGSMIFITAGVFAAVAAFVDFREMSDGLAVAIGLLSPILAGVIIYLLGIRTALAGATLGISEVIALVVTAISALVIMIKALGAESLPEVKRFAEGVSEETKKAVEPLIESTDKASKLITELFATATPLTMENTQKISGYFTEMASTVQSELEKMKNAAIENLAAIFGENAQQYEKDLQAVTEFYDEKIAKLDEFDQELEDGMREARLKYGSDTEAYGNAVTELKRQNDEKIQSFGYTRDELEKGRQEEINYLNSTLDEETKAYVKNREDTTQHYDEKIKENQLKNQEINEIIKNAALENRELTNEEYAQLKILQEEFLQNGVDNLAANSQDAKSIAETRKTDLTTLNAEEASAILQEAVKSKDDQIREAQETYNKAYEIAKQKKDGVLSEEDFLKTEVGKKAAETKDSLIKSAQEGYEGVVKKLDEGTPGILDSVDKSNGKIKTKWQGLMDWFEEKWAGIAAWWDSLWNKETPSPSGSGGGKTPAGRSGRSFSFSPDPIFDAPIPKLARGAVIPPNREFLAVLGDQKNGTNIEAPLDTIVEAFRSVLAGIQSTDPSGTPIVINIGGEKLDSFILSAENRRNLRSGGR